MSTDPHIIPVVAAVLRDRRGRLLVARRPAHKRHGGLWEFPGGKMLEGEGLAEAVDRELQEELGLGATWVADDPIFQKQDPGQPFRILFVEAQARGRVELTEHSEIAWLQVSILSDYPLAPSDAAFARALARGQISVGHAPVTDLDSPR